MLGEAGDIDCIDPHAENVVISMSMDPVSPARGVPDSCLSLQLPSFLSRPTFKLRPTRCLQSDAGPWEYYGTDW